jgi:hypothetical protein
MRLPLPEGNLYMTKDDRERECASCHAHGKEFCRIEVLRGQKGELDRSEGVVYVCGPCLAGAVAIRLAAVYSAETGAGALAEIEVDRANRAGQRSYTNPPGRR